MSSISYESAGVDIEKADNILADVKASVEATFSKAVISPLGGFAGMYSLKEIVKDYEDPVLVQSIDGVGTKSIVAGLCQDFTTIGFDIVSATVNDILVIGAKPLTLLDYVASSKLSPQNITSIITSIAKSCQKEGISLVGGETAEMPDTYLNGEHDIVAIVTGVVERSKIIDGQQIKAGDVVLGLPSNGLHTNGYSLARALFFKHLKLKVTDIIDELGETVGQALLKPHVNYNQVVQHVLSKGCQIKGMAHITGGGIAGNLSRVLPQSLNAEINKASLPKLPLFDFIQKQGDITEDEMFKALNMGVGYCFVVANEDVDTVIAEINSVSKDKASIIGTITPGQKKVVLK